MGLKLKSIGALRPIFESHLAAVVHNLGSTGVLSVELAPHFESIPGLTLAASQLRAPVVQVLIEPVGQPCLKLGR